MQEINESLRDLGSGALETYLSVVNNRMNEIMKVLTIIATIFNENMIEGELFDHQPMLPPKFLVTFYRSNV